jgi:hypothetical protein
MCQNVTAVFSCKYEELPQAHPLCTRNKGAHHEAENNVGCIAEIRNASWWPDAEVTTGASLHLEKY